MTEELKIAIDHHKMGDLEPAEATYRRVLASTPDNPDALHFLGLLLHQKGSSDEGVRLIRKAISRSPGYVDAHNNLGNVLRQSGKREKAEKCYLKAIELNPEHAEAHNNLCVVWSHQQRHEEAISAGRKSVSLNPDSADGWLNLARALKQGGEFEDMTRACYKALDLDSNQVEAHLEMSHGLYLMGLKSELPEATVQNHLHAYQRLLKKGPDTPVTRYMLAVCSGDQTVQRVPDDFVTKLFDKFAQSFDGVLANLDYRVPDLIRARLKQVKDWPAAGIEILDAGCGTGLCGPFLKPLASNLTGVDISAKMLELAERRKLYDKLIECELTAFLQRSAQTFDLIVCADILEYFGDLAAVFDATSSALRPGGLFIFSVEHLREEKPAGFQINPTGRYSHNKSYVFSRLRESGLELEYCMEEALRKEAGEDVAGLIIEARKASTLY